MSFVARLDKVMRSNITHDLCARQDLDVKLLLERPTLLYNCQPLQSFLRRGVPYSVRIVDRHDGDVVVGHDSGLEAMMRTRRRWKQGCLSICK